MKFEKKLVILTGGRDAKGCLRLERNAYGVRAALSCYHLPDLTQGEYILGVREGSRLERHVLGRTAAMSEPLKLDERFDLNSAHFVVFADKNGQPEEVLYGTLHKKRLTSEERLQGFEGKRHEQKDTNLPAAKTLAQDFTYSNRQGVFQDIFPRIEQAYEDDAIAEINYYAGAQLDEIADACGAENAAAFSMREQAYIDGYRNALNRERNEAFEQAAARITPSDLQRGCIHSLTADRATPTTANPSNADVLLPPVPEFAPSASMPSPLTAPLKNPVRSENPPPASAPEPASDRTEPQEDGRIPDDPLDRLEPVPPVPPEPQEDGRIPDDLLDRLEPVPPVPPEPQEEERVPDDILDKVEPTPQVEPTPPLTSRPVFVRKPRPDYNEDYDVPRFSPQPIYEETPSPDTPEQIFVPQTEQPSTAPASDNVAASHIADKTKKSGIAAASADPIEVPSAASTAYVRQGRKLSFYEQVQPQLDELFQNGTPEPELEALLPYTKWVRVAYDADRYYLVGLIGNPISYVCYGIPATYTAQPPAELDGYCQWLPKSASEPNGEGYWLLYQDATTGDSVQDVELN